MEGEQDAGVPMFAIFVISLMSLFLIPFTIYKLCNLASGEAAKPWETVGFLQPASLFFHFSSFISFPSLTMEEDSLDQ